MQTGTQEVPPRRLVGTKRLKWQVETFIFWRVLTQYVREHGLLPYPFTVDVIMIVGNFVGTNVPCRLEAKIMRAAYQVAYIYVQIIGPW